MVTRRDFQKMIDAKTAEEAYKVLSDAPICHGVPMEGYEAALEQNLLDAYQLLDRIAPGSGLTQLFRCQYDGHNLKTAIKARRATGDVSGVYSGLGNLPAKEITAQLESGRLTGIPTPLAQAALEASEALAKTGDPQAVDILLDRGILASMAQSLPSEICCGPNRHCQYPGCGTSGENGEERFLPGQGAGPRRPDSSFRHH